MFRIRSAADFERIYSGGCVASDSILVIHASCNRLEFSRLGVSLPRKAGNAPVRNRWKRVLREAFRHVRRELPQGIDFIIRPRKDAVCELHEVRTSLLNLAAKLATRLEPLR